MDHDPRGPVTHPRGTTDCGNLHNPLPARELWDGSQLQLIVTMLMLPESPFYYNQIVSSIDLDSLTSYQANPNGSREVSKGLDRGIN